MKFTSLFSSSKGNCLYLEEKNTKILIDAGLSGRTIENEIKKLNIMPTEIDAILITHEHSDHISGAGILGRRYNIPLFMTEKTNLVSKNKLGIINKKNIIKADTSFTIKDIEFTPFEIPHDAAEPVGYVFDNGKSKGIIATDMGMIMESVEEYINKCEFIFLESNHDIEMLRNGPYPLNLKKRILSPFGHLSNNDAGILCKKAINHKAKTIMLGHLSEKNNTIETTYSTIKQILSEDGIDIRKDAYITIANKYTASHTIKI